jgi:PAS domain S-box-containing protein
LSGVRKDGQLIPVEIGLDPIDFHGEQMVMVSVLDIRERIDNEAVIRRAMNAAASAMIQVNENGRIELVNEQAGRLFGYDQDELLGMSIEILVPERFRRKHAVYREGYQISRNQRAMGAGRNLFGLRKDGTEFPVEIGLTPIDEMAGKSTMATIIDVTVRKNNERQIQESNGRLKALNCELSEFAYSASHDLKAPLTSIAGLLNYCGSDMAKGDHDEVRRNIERARALAEGLSKRIEDMLSLARADNHSSDRVIIDVPQAIAEVWSVLNGDGTALNGKRVGLMTSFQHAEPFFCVETRFNVILENLLSNALKYSNPDIMERFVKIETWNEGDQFVMSVSDNGIGIAPEYGQKVFGLFQRVSNNNQPGSGLGLALVRKHVTTLKGKITLETNDELTVFKVVLPHVTHHDLALNAEEVTQ